MRFTARSSAAWIVAMLSPSSTGPYIGDIPMQPRVSGKTEGPFVPRFLMSKKARRFRRALDRYSSVFFFRVRFGFSSAGAASSAFFFGAAFLDAVFFFGVSDRK